MQSEHLEKIDQLFQSALDLAPDQRVLFLDEGCAGNPELRQEVESLLAAHAEAGNFIEDSASGVAAELLAESPNEFALVGQSIGQYKIMARLGAGGMGEVYLAKDKMARQVALKILNPRLGNDEGGVARFLREAEALLALNHPNIVTVYDIGRADSTHYIASELIEGQSLREFLSAEREMNLGKALDIAIQVASGVAAAHEKGVIHRDIKPENIMLRPDGYVKVVDFGIAKLVEEEKPRALSTDLPTKVLIKTSEGLAIGTVHYMSPEQARGLPVDRRTDIWSLGVVIYEMLTARRPFYGETPADVLNAILERQPLPLARFSTNVPETLEWIVNKTLRKEKAERYQTATDLITDLQELRKRLEFAAEQERTGSAERGSGSQVATKGDERTFGTAEPNPDQTSNNGPYTTSSAEYILHEIKQHKLAGLTAFMVILMVAAVGAYLYFSKTYSKTITSIAVLPLVNAGGDPNMEYLSDGISESLINSLSRVSALRVMARSTVFRYKGREADVQKVGRELGVDAVLTGRVEQRGDVLVVQADLVNVADGTQLWGEQYNRKLTDLLSLQSEIARDVSQNLRARLSGADNQTLAKTYTTNAEAYRLYLKGRFHASKLTRTEIDKSIQYYQQAIAIDPSYALAYVGLARAFRSFSLTSDVPSNETMPKAKAAALKAIELDETLAEAHIALGILSFWYDWNWQAAEKHYLRALELDSNNVEAHSAYAHLLSNTAQHEKAIIEAKFARELDPLALSRNALEGQFLFYAGRYDDALDSLQKTIDLDANFWLAYLIISRVYIGKGMYGEALEAATKARELSKNNSEAIALIGYSLAKAGRRDEAHAVLDELFRLSAARYVPPYNVALVYNSLGARDKALEWLEKSFQQRDVLMVFLKVEPKWDDLRSDPRFQSLLQRVGFQP